MSTADRVKRRERVREAPDMEAMIGRVLKALVRRCGEGDMDALVALVHAEDMARRAAGNGALSLHGDTYAYSWADIGRALGVTKQAAQQRFGS